MQRRVLGAIALVLVALGGGTTAVGAAGPAATSGPAGFSGPVKVANGRFGALGALAMVVDSTNAVDIAATGRGGLWFITDRGGSWTHHRILADPHNKSWMQPSIAIDSHDHVYIALARQECNDCAPGGSDGVFLITDKGRAHGSFPAKAIKLAGFDTGDPSIKVFDGRIDVVYDETCSCIPGDPTKIDMLTSTNASTWTKSVVTQHGFVPQLRVGTDGRARVAFSELHGIGYAIAATNTGSFSSTKIPGTLDVDQDPLLALDGSNRPEIAYSHFGPLQIRFDRRTATGWLPEENVTELRRSFAFDLDTNGIPRVAQTESTGVHLYTRSGGTWSGTAVDPAQDAKSVALRRAFNGKVDIAYMRASGGIWVTQA
jgi:hypothetical protein